MIQMKGKYNSANVMVDVLDDSTREQIQLVLNHPAFGGSYIAIMPDCHKDMNLILENIKETVEVQEFIKPVYNFKSGGS